MTRDRSHIDHHRCAVQDMTHTQHESEKMITAHAFDSTNTIDSSLRIYKERRNGGIMHYRYRIPRSNVLVRIVVVVVIAFVV